jgi:hypothetical protein
VDPLTVRDADLAVELDDLDGVVLLHPAHEPDRRLLRGRDLVLHAVARVEEDGERDRLLQVREEADALLRAVLEHVEIILLETGDVLGPVHDRDAQRHDLDAAAEAAPLLRGEADRRQQGARQRGRRHPARASHRGPTLLGAWTVTPGRLTVTWSLSGGISVSG